MKKEQKEKEDKFYGFCMKHHTCNGCPRETICFPEEKQKRIIFRKEFKTCTINIKTLKLK